MIYIKKYTSIMSIIICMKTHVLNMITCINTIISKSVCKSVYKSACKCVYKNACKSVYNICNITLHTINYTKYFIFFNYFLFILFNNLGYYIVKKKCYKCYKCFCSHEYTGSFVNKTLICLLYNSINLNGCVMIKLIQWLITNYEIIDVANRAGTTDIYILNLFSNFYENCKIHDINYTKKQFYNEYNIEFDDVFILDPNFDIKSGSIAQVYKANFKMKFNEMGLGLKHGSNIAIKVVHPEIKYQLIYPINFIRFYKFLVTNIWFLKKYDTIFTFDTFFENIKLQTNMDNEYTNNNYFYEHYNNVDPNPYVVIPRPLCSSESFLIMEYISAYLLDEFDISEFEKQKIVLIINLFVKDCYFFLDYYHADLHNSNWKIVYDTDASTSDSMPYKIVIYDFGYVVKNNSHQLHKDLCFYSDINDHGNLGKLLYNNIQNIGLICEEDFIDKYKIFIYDHPLNTVGNEMVNVIYNFCYINNFKLTNYVLEMFVSMSLLRKYIETYLFRFTTTTDINYVIQLNLFYINFCKKHNIFNNIQNYLEDYYKNNNAIISKYKYANSFFEDMNSGNNSGNNSGKKKYDLGIDI